MTHETVEAQAASQEFDALSFEIKHSEDFKKSRGAYYDGEWDAKIGAEPTQETWISYEYRKGYLQGIAEKYDDRFGLI